MQSYRSAATGNGEADSLKRLVVREPSPLAHRLNNPRITIRHNKPRIHRLLIGDLQHGRFKSSDTQLLRTAPAT